MKQFVILREEKKKWLYQNGYLMKEKPIQLGSHTLLWTRNLVKYLRERSKVIILWNTWKIQSLCNNKDKVKNHSCVIYCGIHSCDADYIGETIRNSEIRWTEHMTEKDKNSYCVK